MPSLPWRGECPRIYVRHIFDQWAQVAVRAEAARRVADLSDAQLLDLTRSIFSGETGFSVNFRSGQPAPEIGYMVAIVGYESIIGGAGFAVRDLQSYVDAFEAILDADDHYLGFWVTPREDFIDASERVEGLQDAVALGLQRNQYAIYDLAKGEDYVLKKMASVTRLATHAKAKTERIARAEGSITARSDYVRFDKNASMKDMAADLTAALHQARTRLAMRTPVAPGETYQIRIVDEPKMTGQALKHLHGIWDQGSDTWQFHTGSKLVQERLALKENAARTGRDVLGDLADEFGFEIL